MHVYMYSCFLHIIYIIIYSHALCVMCDVYSCICTCRSAQDKTHINTGTVHYMTLYGPVYTHATEKARDCVMQSTVPVC